MVLRFKVFRPSHFGKPGTSQLLFTARIGHRSSSPSPKVSVEHESAPGNRKDQGKGAPGKELSEVGKKSSTNDGNLLKSPPMCKLREEQSSIDTPPSCLQTNDFPERLKSAQDRSTQDHPSINTLIEPQRMCFQRLSPAIEGMKNGKSGFLPLMAQCSVGQVQPCVFQK